MPNKCPKHPRYYMRVEMVECDDCECCSALGCEEREYCPICRRQEERKQERFKKERCHIIMAWKDYHPSSTIINATNLMYWLPRRPRTRKLARGTRVTIDNNSGCIIPSHDGPLVVWF